MAAIGDEVKNNLLERPRELGSGPEKHSEFWFYRAISHPITEMPAETAHPGASLFKRPQKLG